MSTRILIVEDERKTAAYLLKGFMENGFTVDVRQYGDEGLQLALEREYDLLILDIMLPKRDGWSILTELRRAGKSTPVLFLTARDGVRDRVKGLQMGADDYLVKPFAFAELLARVQSILRRTTGNQPECSRIGDLELDLVRNKASRSGQRLDLTPKEFALLTLLARSKGKPLSRAFIAREVWDINFESDSNVVDVHVRRLRSKLDDPYERKLIHTVRGVGYVLDERA
jgi:two-component system, OmpR family, copper resistance phosphate regulon response regulator CusR